MFNTAPAEHLAICSLRAMFYWLMAWDVQNLWAGDICHAFVPSQKPVIYGLIFLLTEERESEMPR